MTYSTQSIATFNIKSNRNEIEIKEISNSDIQKEISKIEKLRNEHWAKLITQMSSKNIKLTLISPPEYTNTFKLNGENFGFSIFTNRSLINRITNNKSQVDSLYQLSKNSKSVIVGVSFNLMCDRRWNDSLVHLTNWEKTITSMVLNAEEGRGSSLVMLDILYSLAEKDKEGLFSNIFRVLD